MSNCSAGRTEGAIGGPGWVTATCSDCGCHYRMRGRGGRMSTYNDALIERAARVIAEHGFLYQNIGPIHYLCHCAEFFLDRKRWSTHVAGAVLDAVADELLARGWDEGQAAIGIGGPFAPEPNPYREGA